MKTMEQLEELAWSLTPEEMDDVREAAGYRRTGFPYPLNSPSPSFYIKFGSIFTDLNEMEAATQIFVRDALGAISHSNSDGASVFRAPRVPKIFRVFGGRYIVMEYVQGKTLLELSKTKSWEEQLEYIDQIAKAIDILLTIPIPAEATPGPYGGGLIRHPLFKDGEARKIFDDVASLQEHVNYMSTMPQVSRYSADPPRPESTFDNRLYLIYSDLYPGNFIFDADGTLWIIDFEHANLLPLCFQTYALLYSFPQSTDHAYAVHQRMKTELPTDNMEAMKRAGGWFCRCGSGLGIPKAERYSGNYKATYVDNPFLRKLQRDTS